MRADVYLVKKESARSREAAKRLIEGGHVVIDGVKIGKPSENIDETVEHIIELDSKEKYVSRGGLKLEAALDAFGIDPGGLTAADIGASTGGFTDCLLSRGAKFVYALDSGHDQLDPRIRRDSRVANIEGFNARELSVGNTAGITSKLDLAVMDVSFISQTYIIPGIPRLLREGGRLVSLIKPQFEAGRSAVGKGGIVRDPTDRRLAVMRVLDCAAANRFGFIGLIRSPITGGDGNIEYLAGFELGGEGRFPDSDAIMRII